MAHHVTQTTVLGLQIIRPYIFKDYRGEYTETYNQREVLPGVEFKQDSAILSTKGVLRGYHGDDRTIKLITCLQGAFQIVCACIDPLDPRYMKFESIILDDKERLSLVLPPRFVNAHQCLTDTCIFFYKQDTFYKGQKFQYSIRWDSWPGVKWPITPILSRRDGVEAHPSGYYYDYMTRTLRSPEEVNG